MVIATEKICRKISRKYAKFFAFGFLYIFFSYFCVKFFIGYDEFILFYLPVK